MFKPEITVATILERNGRFLLVEEETEQGILLNQPAGHLEADESIQDAAVRETLEMCIRDRGLFGGDPFPFKRHIICFLFQDLDKVKSELCLDRIDVYKRQSLD